MDKGFLGKVGGIYKKYWLVPTTLGIIELGIASYSIYGSIRQGRNPFEIYSEIHQTIYQDYDSILSKKHMLDFENKYKREFREGKNQVSSDELVEALKHPRTVSGLEELLRKDKANLFTEIPFHIMFDYDENKKPFLNLYEISNTLNEKNAIKLMKHQDNPKFISDFLTRNKDHYISVTGINEILYQKSINLLKGITKNKKTKEELDRIKKNTAISLVDLYVTSSDYTCIDDEKTLKDFYWHNSKKFTGKFVGQGHFHLQSIDSPEPSQKDIEASKRVRQVVFAETARDIIVYDLVKGNQKILNAKSLKSMFDKKSP